MDRDLLKEKLNSIRCEMNYLWTGVIVTFGGVFSFTVFTIKTTWLYICIILGLIMGVLFLNAFIIRRIELKNIIDKLDKEGE